MNDQASIRASAFYRIENFVERHDYEFKFAEEKLEGQKRARHFTGDSNRSAAQRLAGFRFLIGC